MDVRYSDGRYIISPITIKQWDNNKHLEEDKFVEAVCSCKELSNLLNYVYEHQLEAGKYSKQKIKEEYERFTREIYRIMKEDEVIMNTRRMITASPERGGGCAEGADGGGI